MPDLGQIYHNWVISYCTQLPCQRSLCSSSDLADLYSCQEVAVLKIDNLGSSPIHVQRQIALQGTVEVTQTSRRKFSSDSS